MSRSDEKMRLTLSGGEYVLFDGRFTLRMRWKLSERARRGAVVDVTGNAWPDRRSDGLVASVLEAASRWRVESRRTMRRTEVPECE